jgi:hypothetical protein
MNTSAAAAQKIEPKRPSIALSIFEAILKAGLVGCTCAEIEADFRYKHQTASPRFNELAHAGCIRPSGEIRSGSEVYVYTPGAGFDLYREWLKQKGKGPKPAVAAPAVSELPVQAPTGMERMVIARAHAYAEAHAFGGLREQSAKNALLEAARWVKRGF